MKEEKELERLFQERFKDFEAQPQHDLWNGILQRMDAPGKRRTPVVFRRRLGVAAAIIVLALIGTVAYLNQPSALNSQEEVSGDTPKVIRPGNDPVVANPEQGIATTPESASDPATNPVNKNNPGVPGTDMESSLNVNNHPPVVAAPGKEEIKEEKAAIAFTVDPANSGLIAFPSILNGTVLYRSYSSDEDQEQASLTAYLFEEDEEDDTPKTAPPGRWAFAPSIAPVYYNTLRNGSPVEQSFDDNYKSGETHLSYGLNIAYQVGKKLSIRTGMNRVTMGYSTNDISFSAGKSAAAPAGNINYSNNNLNIAINDLGQRPGSSFQNDVSKAGVIYNGNMIQRMGYLEVPLELKYKMTGNRLGFHLIGGVSSLFLLDNKILLQSSTLFTEVGESSNINSMNFSTNLGVGLDYWLTNELLFNMEPMFKYQWNTFSGDSGGFSPYLLGIYTGFSFRF